jgi:integrase
MEEGTAMLNGKVQQTDASMKNKIKSVFDLMFNYALEYEIVDRNCSRSFNLSGEVVKEIKTVKRGHIAFSDEEMKLLWDNVDSKYGVDILLIQCYSGWRPQELGLLKLENIDLENLVFKGGMKTEAGIDRTVPIHSRIRPLVQRKYEEAKELGSKYLFTCAGWRKGKNMTLTYRRVSGVFSPNPGRAET